MSKGLGGYSWADPTLTARASILRAVHISDLRTALSQAYVAAGMSAPVFATDPGLGAGMLIKAAHITEIRAALKAIE